VAVVVVVDALIAVGVLIGVSTKGIHIPFLSPAAGSRSHPIPMHTSANIGGGWWVTVDGVQPKANRDFRTFPIPAGAQDYLIFLTLTYKGGGSQDASALVNFILAGMGTSNASYDLNNHACGAATTPSVANATIEQFGATRDVFSGRSVKGNMCLQIASNDASSLLLYSSTQSDPVAGALFNLPSVKTVWFSLR
jgi:hypothetical protein